jgi:hypothetical protein
MSSCSICQEEIITDKISFCCNQVYHFECLSKWVTSQEGGTCPICRKHISAEVITLFQEIESRKQLINDTIYYNNEIILQPPPPPPPRIRRYPRNSLFNPGNNFDTTNVFYINDATNLFRLQCGCPWYYCSCRYWF